MRGKYQQMHNRAKSKNGRESDQRALSRLSRAFGKSSFRTKLTSPKIHLKMMVSMQKNNSKNCRINRLTFNVFTFALNVYV